MAPHSRSFDVLIVGGGIMGCALAYHLSKHHGKRVALCERDSPGAGASGKAGGLVSAQCWNDWDTIVVEESRKEYRRLAEETENPFFEASGGVRAVSTEEGEASLGRTLERLRRNKVSAELLRPSELSALYPGANFSGVRTALFTPDDAIVLPTDLTLAYLHLATEAGTAVVGAPKAGSIRRDGDRWRFEADGQEYEGPSLVIAAGAWSKKVLGTMGLTAPLSPYLTRACLLKVGNRRSFPYLHDADMDVYLRTFPGGDVLAGDGTELREVDPDHVESKGDIPFMEHISNFINARFPAWSDAPLGSSWMGVITSTPDRRPWLGPYPGVPGLHVATGFNGFGLMRAGGAMRRLSLAIVKGDTEPLGPCLAERFPPPHSSFPPRSGFTLD